MPSIPRPCSVEGCERLVAARGLCSTHLKRLKKFGALELPKQPTTEERFWSKVNRNGPIHPVLGTRCWLWTAAVNQHGYGQFNPRHGVKKSAHRIGYVLTKGEIPKGLKLDHLCRVRNCVRGDHLEPVTDLINILRGEGLAARNAQKTHCLKGHLYDKIRMDRNGKSKRACSICHAVQSRKGNAKRTARKKAEQGG